MIILASKSPRRRELMKYITDDFECTAADVDETLPDGISPEDAVIYLSKIKAQPFADGENTVIGADTVVAADGKILGKPRDAEDAKAMLSFLSGRVHSVFTGVTVIKGSKCETFFEKTDVEFYELNDADIEKYVSTREPMDKAGAYGIQGYGCLLVKRINGDYFNVVGLPVSRLNQLLSKM